MGIGGYLHLPKRLCMTKLVQVNLQQGVQLDSWIAPAKRSFTGRTLGTNARGVLRDL